MKSIFITILLVFTLVQVNYSQSYHDKFKSDICDCFEEKFYKLKRASSAYDKCFKEKLPSYASLIDAEIQEDNPKIKFSKGQQVRLELKKQYQVDLMYSCDLYYRAKDEEYRKLKAKGQCIIPVKCH